MPRPFKRSRHAIAVLLTAGTLAAIPAASQETGIEQLELGDVTFEENPALPGVASAMILGAFDAQGLYTALALMREGSTFPPHSHPDLRMTVVLSGTMHLGQGGSFDTDALVAYPAGSVAITPPETPHFMAAPEGDVRVLEIGSGPSATDFIEPQ